MSGDKIVTGIKLSAETRQRLERLQQSSELSSEAQKDIEVDLQRGLLSSKTMKLMMTQEASGKPVFVNTKDLSVVMNRAQNTVKKEEDVVTKQRKEARLEYLKIKQEERVYNQMIYGKDRYSRINPFSFSSMYCWSYE